ncbi:MAG: hypothetical protein WCT29_03260 [Candidatus Paceibacterota bacterium]|jgi:hypothetical protein
MEPGDENKLHKLEDLKSKLFSKSYHPKPGRHDEFSSASHREIDTSWQGRNDEANWEDKLLVKTSMFKKIFIVSVAFFALSVGYAAYVILAGSNTVSNDNIEITVTGNNFIAGGEDLDLVIGIENRNSTSLDLVDLVVEYPKGTGGNLVGGIERLRQSLGTIPAGAVKNENLKLVLFGEQGSVVPIKISIEYRVVGSNAIFVKDKTYNVNINSTPINLSVDGPLSVSPNQDVNLNIKTSLNATRAAEDILVKVDYPLGFQFVKAVPAPSYGNNVWYLGDLAPGAEHGIAIAGKMIDVFEGEEKTFNISSGSQSISDKSSIDVAFNSIRHTIAVKRPFVEANIVINAVSNREFAVDSDTPLNVEVRYANNLSTRVDDVRIEAKISGNAWNRTSIRAAQGHYESSRDVVVWDKSTTRNLAEVNPGDSGSVSFYVTPLSLFSSSGALLADPTINISVSILGRQSAEDASVNELENSASTTVRIISDLGFSSKALYYSGPFPNTGPIPPKAEVATTYTIVWTLSNTSNAISRAQLSSSLPSWVKFVGTISPAGEDLSYNASTRGILWNIDRIPKGSGITGASRSVSFQVSLEPSLSQVGSTPLILNDAILTGHDDFANVDVKATKGGLNTRLDSDPAFPGTGSVVVE